MKLQIISAEKIEFEGEVVSATFPGVLGSFQVLTGHAAMVAGLTAGTMSYVLENEETQSRDIAGGVVDVKNNVVKVCLY